MNQKAKDKMARARAGLILDMRFFGALALKLQFKEDPSCDNGWTDGIRIGYNPDSIQSLSLDHTKTFLAHEVLHCAGHHHVRLGNRNPKKANRAMDYVVNLILKDAGFSLIPGSLCDEAYRGMSWERVYSMLTDYEGGGGGEQGFGEVRPYPGKDWKSGKQPSKAEMQEQEQDWKISTRQAAQAAKACGKLPGALESFVDEILAPQVDWREVLRAYVERSAKNDYDWTRPNRRYMQGGIILPSLHSRELGELVVAIDTSGSVDSRELAHFAGELTSILEEYQRCTVSLVYCDRGVHGPETITQDDLPLKLKPKGGGGTDFRPVFEYVEESGETPACLVYLTDMYGPFPESAPGYPVLWIATSDRKAPFGETVRIEVA